jgi:hypothetical protein
VLRKTIVISFIVVFLCANTEIGQVLKLPNLIQHFLEHRGQDDIDNDHDISFVDFIIIHYNNNQPQNDKGNHHDLPFKTISSFSNTVLAFENPKVFSFCEPTTVFINSTVPFRKELYTSDVFNCIWLPPKLS